VLAAGIFSLAHSLGLRVVAEGVETREQLVALQKLGCERAQGYLLGTPVGAPEIQALLSRRTDGYGRPPAGGRPVAYNE
jgi:EAL domain-containing protein (putative c-di-GMP-specific phosphodiesterase class I)